MHYTQPRQLNTHVVKQNMNRATNRLPPAAVPVQCTTGLTTGRTHHYTQSRQPNTHVVKQNEQSHQQTSICCRLCSVHHRSHNRSHPSLCPVMNGITPVRDLRHRFILDAHRSRGKTTDTMTCSKPMWNNSAKKNKRMTIASGDIAINSHPGPRRAPTHCRVRTRHQ
jgi:hypothetical protein